ncbi:hypothetical protein Atai01_37130 [Amycolatopsis taiwanensis]|uniref:Uncharacterized protein n=1 Tax=Amycolatopsis taiwanensis TaxID=342230 RepID=A0A9W6R0V3_9PSEU|nr:hypothetical protein Atai01_37130 [Amycolatopsis taiwanensis]
MKPVTTADIKNVTAGPVTLLGEHSPNRPVHVLGQVFALVDICVIPDVRTRHDGPAGGSGHVTRIFVLNWAPPPVDCPEGCSHREMDTARERHGLTDRAF